MTVNQSGKGGKIIKERGGDVRQKLPLVEMVTFWEE